MAKVDPYEAVKENIITEIENLKDFQKAIGVALSIKRISGQSISDFIKETRKACPKAGFTAEKSLCSYSKHCFLLNKVKYLCYFLLQLRLKSSEKF